MMANSFLNDPKIRSIIRLVGKVTFQSIYIKALKQKWWLKLWVFWLFEDAFRATWHDCKSDIAFKSAVAFKILFGENRTVCLCVPLGQWMILNYLNLSVQLFPPLLIIQVGIFSSFMYKYAFRFFFFFENLFT